METPARIQKAKALSMVISAIIFLFSLGINLFASHETGFVEMANTIILAVVLLFAAVLAFRLRAKTSDKKEANKVWLLFGIGLVMYALAEISWLIYLLAGMEPPYPGPSDLIYFIAYSFMIVALFNKYRMFNIYPTKRRVIILWMICGIMLILIGIFVVAPIVSGAAETNPLETLVNLYYPLADFVILMIALYLIFTLWGGRISSSWMLIGAGALVLALADILFVYADWNGLYYPGTQINVISKIVDMGYIQFALLFASGVFMQRQLISITGDEVKTVFGNSTDKPITSQPQGVSGHAEEKGVILTDKNHRLVYISDSLRDLYIKFGGISPQIGQPLVDVLAMDEEELGSLMNEIVQKTVLRRQIELPINKKPFPFLLVAIVRMNQVKEFDGMDLSVTLFKEGINPKLKEEIRFVETGNSILVEIWERLSRFEQIDPTDKKILAYLFSKMIALYVFMARLAGLTVAQKISDVFNTSAQKATVGVRFENSTIQYDIPPDVNKMRSLANEVIRYAEGLISKGSMDGFQGYFEQTIPADILDAVKKTIPNM
jgi:hypothetical protein